MSCLNYEFAASRGGRDEITLNRAAIVLAMDPPNDEKYIHGRIDLDYCGFPTSSLAFLAVPRRGSWYVVWGLDGGAGVACAWTRLVSAAMG
jgi:hypothetical protein